jgi:tetratricopeptide (TPR) repeat protein
VDLTPDEDRDKVVRLNNLGASLQNRSERLDDLNDLESAITWLQVALCLASDDHPSKQACLTNLGNCLMNRFDRLGNIADIDFAITQHQAAVNLTPEKALQLTNLGNSLMSRFERLGNLDDINSAIEQYQAAVNLTQSGDRDRAAYLNNLGYSLKARFQRLGNLDDINASITQRQEAIYLTPDDHPDKAMWLSSLGTSLLSRFSQAGNLADVDYSITHQQAAINLTPEGHPLKPRYISNLGNALETRFRRVGNCADAYNAILHYVVAVNLTPDNHPVKIPRLCTLGSCFRARFLRFHHPRDANAAITHLSTAAQSPVGAPTARFKAAERWISFASLTKHQSLLAAYECALGLMPLVAWLGLPLVSRHEHLVQMGGIARDAAAAAISLGQHNTALEWLEQGRSIVWNQVLQLRTPLDELRSVDSSLADRLLQVSRLLDRGTDQMGTTESAEDAGQRYRGLTGEWESIIKEVRSLPNFQDFLRPLQISKLVNAAQRGPVVVVNIAEERCDALALVPGLEDVKHIPLPSMTLKKVTELRDELKNVLYSNGLRMRGERAAKQVEDEDDGDECGDVLAELWDGLVKPILDSLAFSVRFISLLIN